MSPDAIEEARRQVGICNACRYCEGYCAVFPAITRQTAFAAGDLTQLANLCHNCRGCYYACQYAPPHEFALNLPAALAEVRLASWEELAWPAGPARLFQRSGVALAAALVVALTAIFWALRVLAPEQGEGFYAWLGHGTMVAIFLPAFLLPLASIGVGLRRYWRVVGGGPLRLRHLAVAMCDAARMRNLDGGRGQGCNFEAGERYTQWRRWLHQAVLWGFLLCFASTVSGTVLHYLFDHPAPYGPLSPPKLFGVPGGILLVIGCAGLAAFRLRADPGLGARRAAGGEMGFVLLLLATGASGLALYAATGSGLVPALLGLHLATVLALFLLAPFSKMVHGFYRLAALARDAQDRDARG